jgi:hypothetical protein
MTIHLFARTRTYLNKLFIEIGSSHRTVPEQGVGLGIYLLLSFGIGAISGLPRDFLGSLYFLFLALGMWSLWRRYSLRVLKFELSAFLAQFFFQITWSISFFILGQTLLALVSLLLLWITTLVTLLLFWKKEWISGVFFLFPMIWIFYLAGASMLSCMSIKDSIEQQTFKNQLKISLSTPPTKKG